MRRAALALVLVLAVAGCGGSPRSPAEVVRAWSAALRADDNERAASLFAPDAAIVQGDQLRYLHTHADALRWNARLPCAGTVVSLKRDGSAATATFRLGDRKSRRCGDPPGAEAIAVFVVEHGKIVLWAQIGSQVALSH
jgi:limonene-1,2-epoxide hydrolase